MAVPIARTAPGLNGLPKVHLAAPDGATADIYLHGATLTAWVPAPLARNVLFVSASSQFSHDAPIRGGIPLAFPQFAADGPLPLHGFVRTATWRLLEDQCVADGDSGSASAVLALTAAELTPETRAAWPGDFTLRLTVSLSARRLETVLHVSNLGTTALPPFQALQHTYYALPAHSAPTVAIEGLDGREYVDKVRDRTTDTLPAGTPQRITQETDRIYPSVVSPLRSDDKAELVVRGPGMTPRRVRFSAMQYGSGGNGAGTPLPCDVVVWNPWIAKAKQMPDFGSEEYRDMVCVEPGCTAAAVLLAPGESFALRQEIFLLETKAANDM